MSDSNHAAAMAALSEIQGILHKHSIRMPEKEPAMEEEPTEGALADEALDEIVEAEGLAPEMATAEAQEHSQEAEPMRIVSHGGPRRPSAPPAPVKRGPGRPRKA